MNCKRKNALMFKIKIVYAPFYLILTSHQTQDDTFKLQHQDSILLQLELPTQGHVQFILKYQF